MPGVVKTFFKTTVERRRLYLDYDCWLEPSENLVSYQTVVIPNTAEAPLVLAMSYPDSAFKRMVMYAQGGVAGVDYRIQVIVTTDEGQIKRDDIGIMVVA